MMILSFDLGINSKVEKRLSNESKFQPIKNLKKPKMKLSRARKAKSSIENQPVLISAGLLAVGGHKKKDGKLDAPKFAYSKLKSKECQVTDKKSSQSLMVYKQLEEEYLLYEKSFEAIHDEGKVNLIKKFSHHESVHLRRPKFHKFKSE